MAISYVLLYHLEVTLLIPRSKSVLASLYVISVKTKITCGLSVYRITMCSIYTEQA